MNTGDPEWNLYRSFLAVAAEGSLSGAARRLRVTQPTISRHVEMLEAQLGTALFTRSQRGLSPTAMAEEILPLAREMEATAAALKRASSGEAVAERGVVRLTSSPTVAVSVLPAILADFSHLHPTIDIELVIVTELLDLLRRDADIAVRMIRPTQKALVARRLGEVELGLYAHRRYLAARGTPTLVDLERHRLISFDRDNATLHSMAGAEDLSRRCAGFRCDNLPAQMAALRLGTGFGLMAVITAGRDPDLVRIMPERFSVRREIWLVMHEDVRSIRRIRLMSDFLAERLSADLSAAAGS